MTQSNGDLPRRRDVVYFVDVQRGNPNGDPDSGNEPRMDASTNHGWISNGCLNRFARDAMAVMKGQAPGFDILIKDGEVLEERILDAYNDLGLTLKPSKRSKKAKADDGEGKAQKMRGSPEQVVQVRDEMCRRYIDVRLFGGVLSTGPNGGQVRGPVQTQIAESVDPIEVQPMTITRMAVASRKEAENQDDNRTMGHRDVVPYALYKGHSIVSPFDAATTGCTEEDIDLYLDALKVMFELRRSATRGLMTLRKMFVFEHDSNLGNATSASLVEMIQVKRTNGANGTARAFADYEIVPPSPEDLPDGVTLHTVL